MSWWKNATEAQRLAQIDGGIELGLTARQVALASRANVRTVTDFANIHSRQFGRSKSAHGLRRSGAIRADRSAFIRGDRVDLWGNSEPQDEFVLDEVSP